jgi:hypothetical protein
LMTFVAVQALRTPSAQARLTTIDAMHLESLNVEAAALGAVRAHVAKKRWWMNHIGRMTEKLVYAISNKMMTIYRSSTAMPFVTSDDPVTLVRNEIYLPGDRQGFLQAHILFPLGSRAVLCLRLPEVLWPRDDRKHRAIRICEASEKTGFDINLAIMRWASRFIFARDESEELREAFDRAEARDAATTEPLCFPELTIARSFPSVA